MRSSPSRSAGSDITGIWAGLRPLLAPREGKRAPSERTADLSRRHTVRTSSDGLVTVTGGKLTTYRKMAEDTVDAAVGVLGPAAGPLRHQEPPAAGCRTPRYSSRPAAADAAPGVTRGAVASHLAGRYGTETPAVLATADDQPELLDPLVPGLHYLAAEAVYAVEKEMACTLSDVLDRRTRASLRDARAPRRQPRQSPR